MRQISAFAVLLSALATSAPSLGQARDAATAEALFRQGRQAVEAQDYKTACPKFGESQRLDPAVGTLMNWAACEEKLGRLASAWQRWREAIDGLPPKDDRLTFAEQRVAELEKRLPKLAIALTAGADPASKIFRDDIELGPASLGVPLPVDPGEHAIVVRLPGHAAQRVTVSIGEAESKRIDVTPGPLEKTAAIPADQGKSYKAVGIVAGGVGVVGVGAAIVTGVLLNSARTTVRENCVDKACNPKGLDAASSGRTLLPINLAAWIVGGVGLGAGAYFLFVRRDGTSAGVSAAAVPGGAALSARGSF
jgi:hypothetical protein